MCGVYSPGLFSAGIRGQIPTLTLKRLALTLACGDPVYPLFKWPILLFNSFFFWPPLRFKQYCPSPVIYFRSWSCYTPSIRVRRCAVPVTAVKCTIFWKKSLLSLVQPPPPWQRAAQDNHNTIQLILVHNTQRCSFSLILQWLHSFSR